jgi:hypothetical protein
MFLIHLVLQKLLINLAVYGCAWTQVDPMEHKLESKNLSDSANAQAQSFGL